MKQSCKIYAAGLLSFALGFSVCLGFMNLPLAPAASAGAAYPQNTPVIVIDAGHGGFDGGAQAADGTMEKDINLAIAQRLAENAQEYRVEIILTREGDYELCQEDSSAKKQDDLNERKRMMEESGAILAVSIHLNSFPQDPSVYGAQVFYSPDEQLRTDVCCSEEIAKSVQESLETSISDGETRDVMKKNDVLLMKNPPCPFILVECGFLSCPQEADKLKTAEYQAVVADAIWKGINEKLCLPVKNHVPVLDSANK